MSTLEADTVTSKTANTDLSITGNGTGVPNLESGFKVGGTAGLPVSELRTGTDGELITWDASGNPTTVSVGTAAQVLTSNGAGAAPTFQTLSTGMSAVNADNDALSTAKTVSGISSGVKRVTIVIEEWDFGASNGTIGMTIGDSGGLETSGYEATCTLSSGSTILRATANYPLSPGTPYIDTNTNLSGVIVLMLSDASTNTWIISGGACHTHSANATFQFDGIKALSGELTQLQLTSSVSVTGGTVKVWEE